ncbi:MAG TPA: TetR/AcrR family transcriptional regulator [Gemmatimonadales bacterium]|nr:TetR/AcrR family transcriptional regulator [Gemmatimonadales bacterium]
MPDAPPTAHSSPPRWQRRPGARPDEILDAAFTVFGQTGFARAKIEDVARLAGVSKGTVYLYFDSKESLFREMVRARVVAALAEAEAYVRSHEGSAEALLIAVTRRMYARMRGEQMLRLARIVQGELGNFPELAQFYFHEVILRARRLVEQVLERGVASGEFRPVAHEFAARGLCSLLVHTAQMQCFFHDCDPAALSDDQAIEGLIDTYLNGVLAHPADLS